MDFRIDAKPEYIAQNRWTVRGLIFRQVYRRRLIIWVESGSGRNRKHSGSDDRRTRTRISNVKAVYTSMMRVEGSLMYRCPILLYI